MEFTPLPMTSSALRVSTYIMSSALYMALNVSRFFDTSKLCSLAFVCAVAVKFNPSRIIASDRRSFLIIILSLFYCLINVNGCHCHAKVTQRNGFSKKSSASTIDLIELKSCGILISFVGPFTEVE